MYLDDPQAWKFQETAHLRRQDHPGKRQRITAHAQSAVFVIVMVTIL